MTTNSEVLLDPRFWSLENISHEKKPRLLADAPGAFCAWKQKYKILQVHHDT